MAKKDDIILIIAKAFGKQKFTREDTEISKTLSMTTLISEFGLTSEQAKEVIHWCVISCASLPKEQEVLEEGFFSNLFNKVTGRKKNNKNISNSIMRDANSLKSILYANKEAYRHLYLFFKLFNILKESNKSFAYFSRISSQEISQITNQLKDTRSRRNMLATPISNSIFTIKDAVRKLKFILQEVRKELKYDIEPFRNRMSSARLPEIQLESTSFERDGISAHSYEQINQIANILKVDMRELEAYGFRGLVKQIANQIKRLCQDSDYEVKKQNILTLINFFERTLNSVDHYTKMFDIVQDVPTRRF